MKNIHTIILSLFALGLCSCQTTQKNTNAPAVMCSKCQTVWVKTAQPSNSGKGFITYRNEKVMQCPDCENAVVTFFKTGDLKHHCTHCGNTLEHCTQH